MYYTVERTIFGFFIHQPNCYFSWKQIPESILDGLDPNYIGGSRLELYILIMQETLDLTRLKIRHYRDRKKHISILIALDLTFTVNQTFTVKVIHNIETSFILDG